jgi:hypothetical protein
MFIVFVFFVSDFYFSVQKYNKKKKLFWKINITTIQRCWRLKSSLIRGDFNAIVWIIWVP